jgi:hypothetical protein
MTGFDKKRLSDSAKNKLQRIADSAANARGARERARSTVESLQEDLSRIELNISIDEAEVAARRDEKLPIPKSLVQLRADREIIKAEIARLRTIQSEQGDVFASCTQLSTSLAKYVARITAGARSHGIAVETRAAAGETPTDSVERLRRHIRGLRVDLRAVEHAPYPSSESKQRMRALISGLAKRGVPNVLHLIDNREEIAWPTQTTHTMTSPVNPDDHAQLMVTTIPDALAILVWAHRDALIARLDEEIESCSTDKEALTDEQRRAKSAAILADILAIEREEEAFIERMEASGAMFLRRPDADPRAVLGLSSDMPAPDVEPI